MLTISLSAILSHFESQGWFDWQTVTSNIKTSTSGLPYCHFTVTVHLLHSTAVNVFDTKIQVLPPHVSVSRSVAEKYIKMTFRIQQAKNKPWLICQILFSRCHRKIPGYAENKPKFLLSKSEFMADLAYRSIIHGSMAVWPA